MVAACGASATSEKTRPGFLEHVSCGFGRYLENLVVIRAGGTRVQGLGEPAAAVGEPLGRAHVKASLLEKVRTLIGEPG